MQLSTGFRGMGDPALVVSRVGKSFGSRDGRVYEVLREVSFSVAAGELIGVTGRSGSGKTTMLRILAGIDPPSAGAVSAVSPPVLVFQDARVFPWRTVAEHFALIRQDDEWRDSVCRAFSLDRYLDKPAWQLSIGTQKRLIIALALSLRPAVLLLDEALSSVDLETKLRIEGAIRSYVAESRAAAVVVSHDVGELGRLTDRVLLLGRAPATVVATYTLPQELAAFQRSLVTGTPHV